MQLGGWRSVVTLPAVLIDWAAPAAWDKHAPELGELRVYDDGRMVVAMQYLLHVEPRTRELWLDLPRHPNLLDAIDVCGEGVLLRYAALNWTRPTLDIEGRHAREIVAGWGVQLVSMFEAILDAVSPEEHARFLSPRAWIDLDNEVRVAFSTSEMSRRPDRKLDERSVVYVIGRLMQSLVETPDRSVGAIIQRCVEPKPSKRFRNLSSLERACRALGPAEPVRVGERRKAWDHVEEGIGWLAVCDVKRAHASFQHAFAYPYYERYSEWGIEHARTLRPRSPIETPQRRALQSLPSIQPTRVDPTTPASLARAAFLEAKLLRRDLERMRVTERSSAGVATTQRLEVPASLREIRELLLAGRIAEAIAELASTRYANDVDAPLLRARLLALDHQHERAAEAFTSITGGPHREEAQLGLARALIDLGKPHEALAIVDALLATRSRDLGALEARARCLELLGRLDEANDAMKAFMAAVELASDARLSRMQ